MSQHIAFAPLKGISTPSTSSASSIPSVTAADGPLASGDSLAQYQTRVASLKKWYNEAGPQEIALPINNWCFPPLYVLLADASLAAPPP